MTNEVLPAKEPANAMYERYGKPLEAEHRGEYVVITLRGETILGLTALEAAMRARETVGPGGYLFRIGPRVIGRWRHTNG